LCKGYIFRDADFKLRAIEAYYRWNPINPEAETATYKQFMASNGFIDLFKKRHHFSSRCSHFKRRSPPNAELEKKFTDETTEIVSAEDRDRVLNCDETCYKLYPNGILTWAEVGSDNVAVSITGNEKEAIMVMATVRLAG
jgi:hypothetical protein